MTVKQLIALLQTLPQDLPVYLADWSEGYAADIPLDDGPRLLPRVAEAVELPRKWNHPRRVVIGG